MILQADARHPQEDEPFDGLRAPFPWFGGKRRVADLVWDRLGNVDTYNEPFAGSLAVLLGRPHAPKVETVNDLDCYLANFWRALQHDPDQVAFYADWPVNEADLHARHRWLVEHRPEQVMTDPEFYDPRIAGWWVWGQCLWIGSGWCAGDPARQRQKPGSVRMQGQIQRVIAPSGGLSEQASAASTVQIPARSSNRRWQGGGQGGGSGVHAPTLSKQKPYLDGRFGYEASPVISAGLYDYLRQLSARLRRVRVCCGDWQRVLTPSVTTYIGTCGVFLDPPYAHDLRERCYAEDHDISADVRAWALAHGDDPNIRIALCGYQDEHGPHMPSSWECVPWKAHGGYSRTERGVKNREQERIWFSPGCLKPGLPFGMGETPDVDDSTGDGCGTRAMG